MGWELKEWDMKFMLLTAESQEWEQENDSDSKIEASTQ